jgi:hypothetical protein
MTGLYPTGSRRPLHAALTQGIDTIPGDHGFNDPRKLEVENKELRNQAMKDLFIKELELRGLVIHEIDARSSFYKCLAVVLYGN